MQRVQHVENFRELLAVLSAHVGRTVQAEEVRFDHLGHDPRNQWETWAVILADLGPVGFANALLGLDFHPLPERVPERRAP